MTEQEFEKLVIETLDQIKETLTVKAREYRRNSNPFHNFDTGATIRNISRERVLDGFMLKHEISIQDMVDDLDKGELPSMAIIKEKFNDVLIYNIIKKISFMDRVLQAHKEIEVKEPIVIEEYEDVVREG